MDNCLTKLINDMLMLTQSQRGNGNRYKDMDKTIRIFFSVFFLFLSMYINFVFFINKLL